VKTEARTSPASRDLDQGLDSLLRLLDFSSLVSRPEAFERGMEATLYSLMGELAARAGALLVVEAPNRYRLVMAKGKGAQAHVGRAVNLAPATLLGRGLLAKPALGEEVGSDLLELVSSLDLALLAPLEHSGKLVGLLGLGSRFRGDYGPPQRALVERVADITATVVANRELVAELKRVNRSLSLRVHQLHTVFEVSRELNRSLDEPSIFRVLTTTVMGQIFVGVATVLAQADGRVEPVIARGFEYTDGELQSLAQLEFEQLRSTLDGDTPPRALADVMSRAGIQDLVPLQVGKSVEAVIGLGPRLDRRPLADEELGFIRTLGEQALVARDNLRMHLEMIVKQRMERELSIAREIQNELLPSRPPHVEGYELAAVTQPCFEVGGDYYDILERSDGLVVTVGDVVGKSVPAAMMMASVHASLRALATRSRMGLAEIIGSVNRLIARSVKPGRFVTLFYGRLQPDSGRFDYVNAGHNPPLKIDSAGRITRLEEGGLVVGIMEDVSYREGSTQLQSGDLVVMYSDGVTESMNPAEEEFGEQRLIEAVLEGRWLPLDALLERVLERVVAFRGEQPASDDTTLVLMRRS
jgi:sigma-B regulation protein RsbU (phosphoserine phosphatase)